MGPVIVSNQRLEQSGYGRMMLMTVFLTMCGFLAVFAESKALSYRSVVGAHTLAAIGMS